MKNNFRLILRVGIFIFLAAVPFLAIAQNISVVPVNNCSKYGDCDFNDLVGLANNIIQFCIVAGSIVFAIMFMYAGYIYLTAVGDTGKISKAHTYFWNSIIGFVIMLSAWLLVDFILTSLLGGEAVKLKILSK